MKTIFTMALFGVGLVSVGFGQQSPDIRLGKAIPIEVQVSEAEWSPDGQAIMYSRKSEKGTELGIYAKGQYEGKVVVNVPKGDTYQWTWLGGSKSGVVVVTKEVKDGKAPTKQIRIFLVEGETQSAKQIFSDLLDSKRALGVTVNASPLLKHAIFSIYAEKESKSYVLCVGRGDLVSAPDIDRAQGKSLFPCWTVDGTAVYAKLEGHRPGPGQRWTYPVESLRIGIMPGLINSVAIINPAPVGFQEGVPGYLFALSRYSPTPANDSNVLELMPSNAVLRPVRFRGLYVKPPVGANPLNSKEQAIMVQFDKSNAQDNSVWLKRGIEKGTPATLVALHASDTWLAPKEDAVAYLIDGALFIRPILKN